MSNPIYRKEIVTAGPISNSEHITSSNTITLGGTINDFQDPSPLRKARAVIATAVNQTPTATTMETLNPVSHTDSITTTNSEQSKTNKAAIAAIATKKFEKAA